MDSSRIKPFDLFVFVLSLIALLAAIGLAAFYVNNDNPYDVPFLLRRDTYDKVFPFLLGTVAVGGFALAYSRTQRSRERFLEQQRLAKASLDSRIRRLEDIYETVLAFFQNVRLQRRCLRGAFVPGQEEGKWKIRRGIFEEVFMRLNEAQLAGEKIVRTLVFEHDALHGESSPDESEKERIEKLQNDLKAQIGGIQGILRNVLNTAEWQGITAGTSNDEDLLDVPEGFVKFADPSTKGNMGFRKIGEHFDAFAVNIIQRIRQLEAESKTFSVK